MACSDTDSRHQLANAFRGYLTRERGLAQGTVDNYSHNAALFLARLPDPLDEALREMSAGRVLEIMGELIRPGGPSARSLSVPLRSLLRFLHVTGRVPRPLAGAVPTEPRWRLASLPPGSTGLRSAPCWRHAIAAANAASATTPSWSCCHGWDCGPSRPRASPWTTWTGAAAPSWSGARAAGPTAFPCRPTPERPWPPT
jgi:hypothetical protein